MKTFLLMGSMCMTLLLATSCSDEDKSGVTGSGEVRLAFSTDSYLQALTRADGDTMQDENAPSQDKFTFQIIDSGNQVVEEFPYNELENPINLPAGNYTVKAIAGKVTEEGINKAYYEGSSTFIIEDGKTTEVKLEATLANSRFAVAYSEALDNYFSDYYLHLRSSEDGNYFQFDKDKEYDPLYLQSGKVLIDVYYKKQSQDSLYTYSFNRDSDPKTHYNLNFTVSAGGGAINIIFAESDTVEVSIDLGTHQAPSFILTGFGNDSTVVANENASAGKVYITVNGHGKILSSVLSTVNDYLTEELAWPSSLDLVKMNEEQVNQLEKDGFKYISNGGDSPLAVLDFTDLIPGLKKGRYFFTLKTQNSFLTEEIEFAIQIN